MAVTPNLVEGRGALLLRLASSAALDGWGSGWPGTCGSEEAGAAQLRPAGGGKAAVASRRWHGGGGTGQLGGCGGCEGGAYRPGDGLASSAANRLGEAGRAVVVGGNLNGEGAVSDNLPQSAAISVNVNGEGAGRGRRGRRLAAAAAELCRWH